MGTAGSNPHWSEPLADVEAVTAARRARPTEEAAPQDQKIVPRGAVAAKRARKGAGETSVTAAEERVYARWSKRFVMLLKDGGAPALEDARATADPDRYLLGLLGAARAGTIRARVRVWERLCRWLVLQRGVAWPTSPAHVVEYLWSQLAEAPSPTFPHSLLSAVSWVECRAGGDPGARISTDEGLKKSITQATAEAEGGARSG